MKTKSRCLLQKQLQQEQALADVFEKNEIVHCLLFFPASPEKSCYLRIFECAAYLPALLRSLAKKGPQSVLSAPSVLFFLFNIDGTRTITRYFH